MKKCRILSIFVVVILILITSVCVVVVASKKNDKEIYAESVNFVSTSGGMDVYINNKLIINEDMIRVSPNNCSFKPEFTIKRYGDDVENIVNDKLTFTETGKYTITCKVKSSDKYYVSDRMMINVISQPTNSIAMYIKKLDFGSLYVGDEALISSIAEIKHPENASINIFCNELLEMEGDKLKLTQHGVGVLDIYVKFDNITIYKEILFNINPKIDKNDIGLNLTMGGNVVQNNTVQIEHTIFNNILNYELLNAGNNSLINCWVESDIIEIISYNAPTIVFKTLQTGEAVIYVSPVGYADIIFEILIIII